MAGGEHLYNVPELFQKYFNLAGDLRGFLPFHGAAFDRPANEQRNNPYSGASPLHIPTEVKHSLSGVPIYEQISLRYQEKGNDILDYSFPGWPLMELNFPTRITKTEVTDHPGTVKEYMGDGDVEITIRGFLINTDSRDMPLDQMLEIQQAKQLKKSLKATSSVLNTLGVHYLVIENLRFPEVEGQMMAQPFVIDALSDYPYELVIKNAVAAKTLTAQQRARQILLGNQ